MKQLILMRHAKSDWQSGAANDFERPLNKRGRRAAAEMGALLKKRPKPPDRVICSPALRARQTVERVFLQTGWRLDRLKFDESLYLASLGDLIALCGEQARECDTLMLMGHNPGLEDLLKYLCGSESIRRTKKGKVFTTANIATVALGPSGVARGGEGQLLELVRPR
ncbi:MAG: histidine phosphatase family protein [Proteobacteria bacterium]|nr:MAG: histidine phosphatase family protein [Pseudomonadota bacterium]